ncbi:MAG: hypothetical protein VYD18_18265 [Candidatus Latescibacterota bacterium]|nr:hypothetical protein [Candidatus Latescibacterota bacterium]
MRGLVRRGLFGETYYGEGAYIHELKQLNEKTPRAPALADGGQRLHVPPHSLGPVLQWFGESRINVDGARGDRVVEVSATDTGHHSRDPRGYEYGMEDPVTMMCRLASGDLVQIRVNMLSDRSHIMVHYALQGTDGAYESADGFQLTYKVWLRERNKTFTWKSLAVLEEEYLPDCWKSPPSASTLPWT